MAEANLAKKRQQILTELDKAVSEHKFVAGVGEVWWLAKKGRGDVLLIEEGFHFNSADGIRPRHNSLLTNAAPSRSVDLGGGAGLLMVTSP